MCFWVNCVTITSWQLNFFKVRLKKIQWLMCLLSNGFGHIHTSHVSRVDEILWEMVLLYIRTIIQMILPLFHWFTPCGKPPLWQTTDFLHEAVPTLTPSTHQVGNFVVRAKYYGSAEGPPRGVENRNLLSHPDDLRMEAYVIRMT